MTNDKQESADKIVGSTDGLDVDSSMKRIAQRRPGNSRLVYDRTTRTIRIRGQQEEDKGDSGLIFHDA